MELSKFENGIVMHNKMIKHAIELDDLYVTHEDGYSYTVGMQEIGAPELVLYGHRKAVAEEIFKIIYSAAAHEFCEPDVGTIVNNVFDPAPGLEELSKSEKMALFYAARTFYESWSFDAYKIIINNEMSVN